MKPPSIDDVVAARERLKGVVANTPLIESETLSALVGGRVLLKLECLQHTGSFKFRGAYNKVSTLNRAQYPGGVVAFGSGNHPQGVALAARRADVPAVVLMPEDAPLLKRDRAARLGATVQLFDRVKDDREALATRLCGSRKALLVPPFDDPEIVAGQGTVAIEILEAVEARLDAIYVPCGGGGLISGVGLAFNACSPETGVIAVEPVGFDDLARSLRSGIKERNPSATGTICDALQAASTGVLTYEMAKRYVQAGVTVRDDQVRDAMRFAFRELKVVVEPGGAVGLAAVLAGAPLKGKTVAVVVSGGNADPFLYASIIAKA